MQVEDGEGDVPPGNQHGGHPHEQLRLQLPLCQHWQVNELWTTLDNFGQDCVVRFLAIKYPLQYKVQAKWWAKRQTVKVDIKIFTLFILTDTDSP